jgi:hypothetical protein
MNTEQRIEIPLSKSKIIMMLIGATAFVAIGLWFVIAPPEIKNSYWGNPTKMAIVGYASILFFGLCAAFFIRKLPDTKPGLVIDNTGLIDNSGALSAGQILWADIVNISVLEMHKQKLLMLEVNNPQDYIDRQNGLLKRKGMELNYKMYGTPLSITANGLKMPFPELYSLVSQKFQEARTNAQQRFAAIQAKE